MLSNRLRELLALQVMYLVGYSHYHGRPPWSLEQLIEFLDLPGEALSRVIGGLVEAGYLAVIDKDDAPVYLPLRSVDTILLSELLDDVRKYGEVRQFDMHRVLAAAAVQSVVEEVDAAGRSALGDKTLKDLVESGEEPSAPRRLAGSVPQQDG